jgi:(2Fe-2S) ferredoxin
VLSLCALAERVVYAAAPGAPPGGAWYCGLTPEKMRRIVAEHVAGGAPVGDLLHRWTDPTGLSQG